MTTMKGLSDEMRKKAARLRRVAQNKKRRRNTQMGHIPGWEAVKALATKERARREFIGPRIPIDLVSITFVFQSTTRSGRKGYQYRNPGKAAVRRDRKIRKERQKLQKKMRRAA